MSVGAMGDPFTLASAPPGCSSGIWSQRGLSATIEASAGGLPMWLIFRAGAPR